MIFSVTDRIPRVAAGEPGQRSVEGMVRVEKDPRQSDAVVDGAEP